MSITNEVRLIGRLGQDCGISHTTTGAAVVNVSLATNEKYKNAEGDLVEHTEWHRLVAWNKTAEILDKYGTKGTLVAVSGAIRTRSYEDLKGTTKYVTEVNVKEVRLLSSKDA